MLSLHRGRYITARNICTLKILGEGQPFIDLSCINGAAEIPLATFATRWGDTSAAAAPELWPEGWLPLPWPEGTQGWLCSAQENKQPWVPGPTGSFCKGLAGCKIPTVSLGSVGHGWASCGAWR